MGGKSILDDSTGSILVSWHCANVGKQWRWFTPAVSPHRGKIAFHWWQLCGLDLTKWPWAEGQGTLPLWMLQQMISVNVSYYDRMGYYVLTEINCLIKFCIFWYNEIPFHYKPRYKCLSKRLGLYKSPEQVPWHWFSRWTSIGGWMPSHMMIPTLPYVSIGLKLQRQQLIIIWVYCLAATSSGHSHFEGS